MSVKSWQSYWRFSQEVTRGNRYNHSDEVKVFLSNVRETSEARVTPVKPGRVFWRAQLGSDWLEETVGEPIQLPLSPERMKPVPFEASEGRVNPKGIPYLYLATDKETAMS